MNFNFSNTISIDANGQIVIRNAGQQISISHNGISISGARSPKINMTVTTATGRQNRQDITLNNNRGIRITNYGNHRMRDAFDSLIFDSYDDDDNDDDDSGNDSDISDLSYESSIMEEENFGNQSNYNTNSTNYAPRPREIIGRPLSIFASQGARVAYGDYYSGQHNPLAEQRIEQEGLRKTQINSIPTTTYKKQPVTKVNSRGMQKNQEPSTNNTCAICIGDYKIGDQLRSLKCRHNFHKDCLDKWLAIKNECPVCKSKIIQINNGNKICQHKPYFRRNIWSYAILSYLHNLSFNYKSFLNAV